MSRHSCIDEATAAIGRRKLLRRIKVTVGGCWEWQGSKTFDGYGRIRINNVKYLAHRLSYMTFKGDLPEGQQVCHRCDNPACINPEHLFSCTQLENIADRHAKGRDGAVYGENSFARRFPERVKRGEDHPDAKLTREQVRNIREEYRQGGVTQRELSNKYGVSRSHIANIVRQTSIVWKEV